MKIEMKNINEIKPYKNNPRKNNKTIEKLKQLLVEEKIPFDVPIVIDKQGVIVKGHSRYCALKELGVNDIPVIISQKSDEINNKDRILDNAVQELSMWKPDELSVELRENMINIDGLKLPTLQHSIYSNEKEDYATLYNSGVSSSSVQKSTLAMFGIADEKKQEHIDWKCSECGGEFLLSRKEVEGWGQK